MGPVSSTSTGNLIDAPQDASKPRWRRLTRRYNLAAARTPPAAPSRCHNSELYSHPNRCSLRGVTTTRCPTEGAVPEATEPHQEKKDAYKELRTLSLVLLHGTVSTEVERIEACLPRKGYEACPSSTRLACHCLEKVKNALSLANSPLTEVGTKNTLRQEGEDHSFLSQGASHAVRVPHPGRA
jgi:hypothetical protein